MTTGEGFEIGMRTVASGNPGGSNGWEGLGREEEELMMAGEGEDEVGGEGGGGGEEGVDDRDLGRGKKEEEEWGEDGLEVEGGRGDEGGRD